MASTVATVLFVLMMITSSTGGGDLLEAAAPAARSAGGSSAGGELAPSRSAASGGGTGGEFMPGSPRGSATAAVSALVARQLAELGNNCSSGTDCFLCVFDNIAPCVADAFTCVDDPWVMLKCFFGKITFIKQICFGSGGGSKKGLLTELVVVPAGGSTGGATTRTTTRAHLSALLRNEVAILPDVGINCSGDCVECLTDSIGPCIVDGVFCFIPFELVLCLVDKYKIIKGCFGI